MGFSFRKFFKGINIVPVSATGLDTKGDMEVDAVTGRFRVHNGTTSDLLVTVNSTDDLQNKTILNPNIITITNPIKFQETGGGINTVGLQAPVSIPSDYLLTFPSSLPISTQLIQVAADGTMSFTTGSPSISDNSITNNKIRQSTGTSVIGNATGSTANIADIIASSNNTVLKRDAGILSFAQIVAADITNGTITSAKIATDTIFNGNTGTTGSFSVNTGGSITQDTASLIVPGTITFSNGPAFGRLGNSGIDGPSFGHNASTSVISGLYYYVDANYAQQIRLTLDGRIIFYTAPIGSMAGDPISFVEQVVIDDEGIKVTGTGGAEFPLVCSADPGSIGLKIVRGTINANGTTFKGEGFTATNPSTGIYTITFTTPFSGVPSISTSLKNFQGFLTFGSESASSFEINTLNTLSVLSNMSFSFIAISER